MNPCKTPEEHAAEIIKESEKLKAHMYEVQGKYEQLNSVSVAQIDQDYQIIDAHIEEGIKRKIQNYEFIELGKLLCKQKGGDDQRMEIVNCNGFIYLSPISEREQVQINSYNKWEQGFRVYCNALTAKYPHKTTELLQYNHTIHTVSASYHWENVAAYDREFRQHIA